MRMRFLADSINMEDIKSALNFLTIEKGRFLFWKSTFFHVREDLGKNQDSFFPSIQIPSRRNRRM